MVVTDPSGEIANKTEKALIKKGFNILKINPLDPQTETYNPLLRANEDDEMKEVSKILINSSSNSSTSESFWNA
jgi:type IV secretory pathway TraG/TraD family ATPase VirD4